MPIQEAVQIIEAHAELLGKVLFLDARIVGKFPLFVYFAVLLPAASACGRSTAAGAAPAPAHLDKNLSKHSQDFGPAEMLRHPRQRTAVGHLWRVLIGEFVETVDHFG
jgi:hypothetical protein